MDLGTLTASLGIDTRQLKEAANSLKQFEKDSARGAAAMTKAFKIMTVTAVAAAAATLLVGRSALKAFSELDKGLIGIQKTTNFTDKQIQQLNKNIRDMSLHIPVAVSGLLEIAEAAGQLGVQGVRNVTLFTETMAKLQISTDVIGAEGAKSLARLLNTAGEGTEKIKTLGSVIVSLGNQMAATESEIVHMAGEIGRATAAYSVSSEQAAAYGAALKAMGARAEISGSAISKSMIMIDKALLSGGQRLEFLEKITQKTGDQLRQTFDKDAGEVFTSFIKGLNRMSKEGHSTVALLEQFGLKGLESVKGLSPLIVNVEQLEKALKIANKEVKNATALDIEAINATKAFSAQLQLTWNAVNQIAAGIGKGLAPTIIDIVAHFRDWVKVNEELINQKVPEWVDGVAGSFKALVDVAGFAGQSIANFYRYWLVVKKAILSTSILAQQVRMKFNEGEGSEPKLLRELTATRNAYNDVTHAILELDKAYADTNKGTMLDFTEKIATQNHYMGLAVFGMNEFSVSIDKVAASTGKTISLVKELTAAQKAHAEMVRQLNFDYKVFTAYLDQLGTKDWEFDSEFVDPEMAKSIVEIYDAMESVKEITDELNESLEESGPLFESSIFGDDAHQGIQNMMKSLEQLSEVYSDIAEQEKDLAEDRKNLFFVMGGEEAKAIKAFKQKEMKYADQAIQAQLGGYRQLFGTIGGLFEENSRARQAMHMLEMAFAVAEMAIMAQKALVSGVGAVLGQGQGEPYSAFARIAAMAGIVAGFLSMIGVGFAGGGGSGSSGSIEPPSSKPSTVLGADAGTGSESLLNALEILQDQNDDQLYALYDIFHATQDLTQSILEFVVGVLQGTVGGGGWSGKEYKIPGFTLGEILNGSDVEGVSRGPAPIWEDYTGFGGAPSPENFVKDFLDWVNAGFDELDDSVLGGFTDIFRDMATTFSKLAIGLGVDVQNVLDYSMSDIHLDLTGLSESEINEAITNYFSNLTDQMAVDLFGDVVGDYQQIGEGMFETAVRVASEKESILSGLRMTGHAFEGTATEAVHFTQVLIDLADSFEDLADDFGTYFSEYLTEAEQLAWTTENLAVGYAAINQEMPTTRQGFKDLITSLDLTNEADAKLYVQLLALAGASDAYYDVVEAGTQTMIDAWRELTGTVESGRIADIAAQYGLDPSTITKDWFKTILDIFKSHTPEEVAAWFISMGWSAEQGGKDILWLADIFGLTGDAAKDTANDFANMMESIRQNIEAVQNQIDKTLFTSQGGTDPEWYMNKMSQHKADAEYLISIGDLAGAMRELQTGSAYLTQWYSAAVAEATRAAQEIVNEQREVLNGEREVAQELLNAARAWGNLVDTIDSAWKSIKYSAQNVSVPLQKAIASEEDYYALRAKSGDSVEDAQKFVSFASTFLDQQREQYASGSQYVDAYNMVESDLAALRDEAVALSYDEAILAELERIDEALNNLEVVVNLSEINVQFANMVGILEGLMAQIQSLELVLNIDWENYTPTMAEALNDLMLLVETYGWDHVYTLTFLAEVPLTMFSDLNQLALAAGWIADSSGGWNSTATISFLKNIASNWEFDDLNQILAAIGYVKKMAGGWEAAATIEFIASLMGKYLGNDINIDSLDYWLSLMGLNASNFEVWKNVKVNLIYSLVSSGNISIPDLANWEYAQIVGALTEPYGSTERWQGLRMAEDLAAAFGVQYASGLGTLLAINSTEAQAAGWTTANAPGAAADIWQNNMGYTKFFEQGGLATGPTSGYPAVLHGTELIIPMNDGLNVPVKMLNGGSTQQGATDINITLEIDGQPLDVKIKRVSGNTAETHRVNLIRRGKHNSPERQSV